MRDDLGILSGATRIDIVVIKRQTEGQELRRARGALEPLAAWRELWNLMLDRISLVLAEPPVRRRQSSRGGGAGGLEKIPRGSLGKAAAHPSLW